MSDEHGQSNDNGEYMTHEGGKPVKWWKSKKFTGYMVGDFTWKAIIFVSLYIISTSGGIMSGAWLTFMFSVVVTAGVAQMGFLGGQAWIDRYTQAIKIPATLGSSVVGSVVGTMKRSLEEKKELPAPEPKEPEEKELVDPEQESKDEK